MWSKLYNAKGIHGKQINKQSKAALLSARKIREGVLFVFPQDKDPVYKGIPPASFSSSTGTVSVKNLKATSCSSYNPNCC